MISLHFKVVNGECIPLFAPHSSGYLNFEQLIMTVDVFTLTIDQESLFYIANGLASERDRFAIKRIMFLPDITDIPPRKWGSFLHFAGRLWDGLQIELNRLSRREGGINSWFLEPNVDLACGFLSAKIQELKKAISGVEKALLVPDSKMAGTIIAAQAASPIVWKMICLDTSGKWLENAKYFREQENCYINVA